MIVATCPICNFEFEDDRNEGDGNCPQCNAHYEIDFDCEYEDAVLIADFDYYYLPTKEQMDKINEWKINPKTA